MSSVDYVISLKNLHLDIFNSISDLIFGTREKTNHIIQNSRYRMSMRRALN